jgi:DNA-binding MarR family transcriptional regulator
MNIAKVTITMAAQQMTAPAPIPNTTAEAAYYPFNETACALLKAGLLFSNYKERPFLTYEMKIAETDVLFALASAEGKPLNCSEIAEKTLITKGGTTGVIDRLEAKGLVKRVHSRQDRRSVLVQMTAKGIEFFRKVFPEAGRRNHALFQKAFTPDEMKQFSELLGRLIRTLEGKSSI